MNKEDATMWGGRYLEDFHVGDRYEHPMGRTVTQADNIWFTLLTQNCASVHVDANYAANTDFGRPLVNSTIVLAIVTGQSTFDVSFNVYANLGWDEVRMPHPVFEGDTLYSSSEVLSARPSKSRPSVGIVQVATTGRNQYGDEVILFRRTVMVYRRKFGPRAEGRIPASARTDNCDD
jgi:itaconyl-CoA hydratase